MLSSSSSSSTSQVAGSPVTKPVTPLLNPSLQRTRLRSPLSDIVRFRRRRGRGAGSLDWLLALRLPDRCVNRGKDVSDPTEEEEPENAGQDEESEGREHASLSELPEPRDEEADECGNHVSGRALSHIGIIRLGMATVS